MQVIKTLQGGSVTFTDSKRTLSDQEYENLQRDLHDEEDVALYSANRQQTDHSYDTINEENSYPRSIRNDLIDVKPCDPDVCDSFVNVPVAGRYDGVIVLVNTHAPIKDENEWKAISLF